MADFPCLAIPPPITNRYGLSLLPGTAYLGSHGAEVSTGKEKKATVSLPQRWQVQRSDVNGLCTKSEHRKQLHSPKKMALRPRERQRPASSYLIGSCVVTSAVSLFPPGAGLPKESNNGFQPLRSQTKWLNYKFSWKHFKFELQDSPPQFYYEDIVLFQREHIFPMWDREVQTSKW